MARRNGTPQVELLEGRLALSGGGAAALAVPHRVALNGQVGGTFLLAPTIPDTGDSQAITAAGSVAPLGKVNASGLLTTPGFIARGRATGSITLSNTNGSVTIQLTGPIQKGFSVLPRNFSFKIVSATGEYADATDRGRASITEVEADGVSPTSGPHVIVGPIFGMTLHSS